MRRDSGGQAWSVLGLYRRRPCRVCPFVLRYHSASVASDFWKEVKTMSLYKRSATWWIRFTTPAGERIRRSTGTADKARAQELHDKLKAESWRTHELGEKPKHTWMMRVTNGSSKLNTRRLTKKTNESFAGCSGFSATGSYRVSLGTWLRRSPASSDEIRAQQQ